ncbi:MAG: DUF2065 domain-containing protein [Candidatus Muproteobacteria bacterium RIFCSPHIGHO2_12_FULL_60_33]|uniref:DUF2065 domain-containing protein n=1 Tax=Candidatus Muproteobacteria bacterium RIFCSPLOWO2_01_FULL_60_18 TaxID=1817768 RepID=A0A1F6U0Q2_9PROT|nr:MAG: DUF2065 domain-containing protein [Candidatus Muproteobacteria bacterium RIFCSPLOWO2_01_FULL_60_18]OGI53915.1 MAG: DUF2065 domain-containing protein [Candidatus Muproteobacteria bacterium RIFCSPHIGHO2_12_FULL_60_33]
MWHDLWIALALLLILEGIFPFLSPDGVRKALAAIHQLSDSQLRFAGLTSMLAGVVLLYIINR